MTEHKSRIYTKSGDKGKTSLIGGARVSKGDPRLAVYGTLDELNSQLGLARALRDDAVAGEWNQELDAILERLQNLIFNLGSILACREEAYHEAMPKITNLHIEWLEQTINQLDAQLPPLKQFILPGGAPAAAALHVARTVCRRAERLSAALMEAEPVPGECFRFLNRLSDLLFVLARWVNHQSGVPEHHWKSDMLDY